MIKAYSLKGDGGKSLSKNFKVKEFRCKDGSDTIKISEEMVSVLQKIRDKYNLPVTIISAYRTAAYNKKVGGASASQHLYGTAVDIRVAGVENKALAIFAEALLGKIGGIGFYDYSAGFVHVDVRAARARWKQDSKSGKSYNVAGFYMVGTTGTTTLKQGSKGTEVKKLQDKLNTRGFGAGANDGVFGAKTLAAVKAFQKANKLTVDGIAGQKTLTKLYS